MHAELAEAKRIEQSVRLVADDFLKQRDEARQYARKYYRRFYEILASVRDETFLWQTEVQLKEAQKRIDKLEGMVTAVANLVFDWDAKYLDGVVLKGSHE